MVWIGGLCTICATAQVGDELSGKSLEELLRVPVTLQRRSVALEDMPAAVYVITPEEIRRMGFSSIPEALRMVPGLEVAQIDGSSWAISSRGFNGRFANKLLVLIDGQSVYTPNFSGVFWDEIDLPLEILDHIEVIRGPGGTLFGPNAVNGIINIITKRAGESDGVSLQGRVGEREHASGAFVFDMAISESTALRVHGQPQAQGANRLFNGMSGHDGWDRNRIGMRLDWDGRLGESATLIVGGYRAHMDRHLTVPTFSPPFNEINFDHVDQSTWNILGRYELHAGAAIVEAQVGYDRSNRTILHAREDRKTLDADISTNVHLRDGLDFQAGIGYRTTEDEITGSFLHSYFPTAKTAQRFTGFVQGAWELSSSTNLVLGAKVLHDEYAGWQVQPSVRVLHVPSEDERIWASLTHAVRTPSRADRTVTLIADSEPGPGGLPLFIEFQGSPGFDEETVLALEAGYRRRLGEEAYLDTAAYLNFYEGLRTFEPQDIEFRTDPAPHWVLPMVFANKGRATTMGTELFLRWAASPNWRLALGVSVKSWRYRLAPDSADTLSEFEHFETPKHQVSLQSYLDLGGGWTLDAFLSYVDSLLSGVDAYWRFDTRLGCRLRDGTEIELGVQNAFRPASIEFPLQLGGTPSQVAPRFYFGMRRGF